ncbi:hypothetical protein T439DRAFT_320324 [Meredithblackwellia eburnea MCA 4105]
MATVNLVICSLSFVGGAGIVVGYFLSPQQRLRQKMVLGLGACDVLQALVVLIGTARSLEGHKMIANSSECLVSGFFYQTCVVVSAAWTLAVAVVTYVTLIYPMSTFSALLEHRFATPVMWAAIWLCGLIPAAFGTAFFSMEDYGGLCWYNPTSLQAKLMTFVPRAVTLLLVIILYIRLFVFFRRRDVGLLETSADGTSSDAQVGSGVGETSNRASYAIANVVNWARRSNQPVTTSRLSRSGIEGHLASTNTAGLSSPAPSEQPYSPPLIPFENRNNRSVFITLPTDTQTQSPSSENSLEDEGTPDLDANYPPGGRPDAQKRMSAADHQAFAIRQASQQNSVQSVKKRLSARQLNRRTSILMMLYPLAYLLLFSVAVGKLATQIATNKPTHPALTSIARWLVYAQGLVDGLIYFVIEAVFRRSTRGRT